MHSDNAEFMLQAALSSTTSQLESSSLTSEAPISTPIPTSAPVEAVEPDVAMDIDSVPLPLPPVPDLTKTGRPRRNYQLPRRFQDFIPELAAVPDSPPAETGHSLRSIKRVILKLRDQLITAANSFGIWRDYPRRPTRDPDASLHPGDLKELSSTRKASGTQRVSPHLPNSPRQPYWPFANSTIHGVMQWLNNGNTSKSEAQTNEFINKVILSPDFCQDHLVGFNAHRENLRLDEALEKSSFYSQFKESTVDILVPSGAVGVSPKIFTVSGLLHRKLTAVISGAFTSSLSHLYHFSPFKLYHHSPITKTDERIFGEIYTSDAFLEEHERIQRSKLLPPEDLKCQREKSWQLLCFSSDATHLTNFGSAKAWPVYLMLGNLSKYIRAQPNSGAMHHLAYIPSVSNFSLTPCSSILNFLDKATGFVSRLCI